MALKNVSRYFSLAGFLLGMNLAQAGTHVWIPLRAAQGYNSLPEVVVIGERINWGAGYFDNDNFTPDNNS